MNRRSFLRSLVAAPVAAVVPAVAVAAPALLKSHTGGWVHGPIRHSEMLAILERGESVLTKAQVDRVMSANLFARTVEVTGVRVDESLGKITATIRDNFKVGG